MQPDGELLPDGVFRAGAGPPLVLIHGFTGSWRIWRPVLPGLAQHHDVAAITLAGHRGGPAWTTGIEVSVATLADRAEITLDELGIDTAHLCGNSLGGWLSLELARRGRAESVTALAPAGGWSEDADVSETSKRVRSSARMASIAKPFAGPALFSGAVRRAAFKMVMERGDRLTHAEAQDLVADAAGCTIVDEFADATGRDGPFAGAMEHVTAPVRIAWSQNDRLLVADDHGRPLLDRLPNASFTVLPGVGHTPMFDDPLLVVATILETTLAATPRAR